MIGEITRAELTPAVLVERVEVVRQGGQLVVQLMGPDVSRSVVLVVSEPPPPDLQPALREAESKLERVQEIVCDHGPEAEWMD